MIKDIVKVDIFPKREVTIGQEFTVQVMISKKLETDNCIILFNRYGEHPSIVRSLKKMTKEENDFEEYCVNIQFNQLGNYFFFFLLEVNGEQRAIKINRATSEPFILKPEEESPYWKVLVKQDFSIPEWAKDKIFYQIFIDRFYKAQIERTEQPKRKYRIWGEMPNWHRDEHGEFHNNDFFCGNLKGIEQKLEYIKSLGVGVIYISPINESLYRYERYASTNHMEIDPDVGTFEDLNSLHNKARKMGMYLILDIAFNHCSSDNPIFQEALKNPNSKYRNWFYFDEFGNYEYWYGIFKDMPVFNQYNPEFQEYIYGPNGVVNKFSQYVDGFRLDLAESLKPFFLEGIRNRANENGASLIVGEYWEKAGIDILGKGIDCPTNYMFTNPILKFVAYGENTYLEWQIQDILNDYPQGTIDIMLNSLDTHDTVRALTILGGKFMRKGHERIWEIDKEPSPWHSYNQHGNVRFDTDAFRGFEAENDILLEEYEIAKSKLKIATILQYFLPGNPCIYYGTEVGVHGYKDPFNRKCYPWGNEDVELLNFYRKIGEFRNSYIGANSDFKVIHSDNEIFLFERENEKNSLFVAVNRSNQTRIIELPEKYWNCREFTLNVYTEYDECYLHPYSGMIVIK